MKLNRLHLSNFRGFEDLTLDLHKPLTVLVGVNGAGKTSLLEALEIAASHFVAAALGDRRALVIHDRDIRFRQKECRIELRAGDTDLSISHALGQPTLRVPQTFPPSNVPLLAIVLHVDRSILQTRTNPEPASRAWIAGTRVSAHPAWDDSTNAYFTSFEHFERWFRQQEDLENQDRVRTKNLEYSNHGLACSTATSRRWC